MTPLEVTPIRWFSSDYRVRAPGRDLTLLDLATLRSRGGYVLDGVQYVVRPEGLLAGKFVLERDGRILARAERTQIAPLRYRITAGDRLLEMRATFPGRTFRLHHGDRDIGRIAPRRWFTRAAIMECSEELSDPIAVFMIALAILRWRRRARSRSG